MGGDVSRSKYCLREGNLQMWQSCGWLLTLNWMDTLHNKVGDKPLHAPSTVWIRLWVDGEVQDGVKKLQPLTPSGLRWKQQKQVQNWNDWRFRNHHSLQ
mmetsp:Transcript_32653/g.66730  ORF Transcript_32653/g.66730 Transcript_32653/m.66730 type:complete len:99 (+) Transcript_32653:43-339(+)